MARSPALGLSLDPVRAKISRPSRHQTWLKTRDTEHIYHLTSVVTDSQLDVEGVLVANL